ncbi:unnamed protein product [Orchesella dallaii]|uniref:Gustatory receptor n=1 Tax=Orchesella dallaii TaxID=48710 RepID=A0ABP1R1A5_9HEXA
MDNKYYRLLRPLLRFGQVLGFPHPGTHENVKYSRYGVMAYSIFMTLVSLIKFFLTVGNVAKSLKEITLFGSGVHSPPSLPEIFRDSPKNLERHKLVYKKWSGKYQNASFLEKYLDTSNFERNTVESFNNLNTMLLGTYYFLSKLLTFATDYSDALCITLAFGISARLNIMNEYLRVGLHLKENYIDSSSKEEVKERTSSQSNSRHEEALHWPSIYRDFANLRQLSDLTSKFISPLLFVSLIYNVSAVVSILDYGINLSSRSQGNPFSYSSYISLWHYLIRTVLVIHFASGVYKHSDETLSIIENAPDSVQTWADTQPILGMLRRKPIGIIFFDSFFVTKCCFISILNFVFTIEIMVLQSSSSGTRKLINDYY